MSRMREGTNKRCVSWASTIKSRVRTLSQSLSSATDDECKRRRPSCVSGNVRSNDSTTHSLRSVIPNTGFWSIRRRGFTWNASQSRMRQNCCWVMWAASGDCMGQACLHTAVGMNATWPATCKHQKEGVIKKISRLEGPQWSGLDYRNRFLAAMGK